MKGEEGGCAESERRQVSLTSCTRTRRVEKSYTAQPDQGFVEWFRSNASLEERAVSKARAVFHELN